MTRSSKPTCADCAYFKPSTAASEPGECRLMPTPIPKARVGWCGQFRWRKKVLHFSIGRWKPGLALEAGAHAIPVLGFFWLWRAVAE